MTRALDLAIKHDVPIPTWFGVGGRADQLALVRSVDDARRCLELDPNARVFGEGANLIVADEGVGELVMSMNTPEMRGFAIEGDHLDAMAGAGLARLVTDTVRAGLAGLEGLGGIPACIGGATFMNAGGRYGEIADVIERVHALNRAGEDVALERDQIDFGYRHSGLAGLLVTRVELRLTPGDPAELRRRLKESMAYKKTSQPMAAKSAGCVFKNSTLVADVDDIGVAGQRVGAGLLIDRAGCKGLTIRGASVSQRHANFVVTSGDAAANDVLELIDLVRTRVADAFGVTLEREVVVWRRNP